MNDSTSFFLTYDHMMELERIYNDLGEKSFDQDFCKEIAAKFRSESKSPFETSISWEQVQKWFQNKHREPKDRAASSSEGLNLTVDHSDNKSPNPNPKPKGIQAADLDGLAYEARSVTDHAWHDVAMFLNYRVLSNGGLEARVRYHGFGKEYDEWINVHKGVRQRSIPLEASDCHKVKEGHLVLCFLARSNYNYDLYCDARVTKIQRGTHYRIHDSIDCSCIFTVQFCHDKSEKEVRWNRLRCRPTQEESDPDEVDHTLNTLKNLWG